MIRMIKTPFSPGMIGNPKVKLRCRCDLFEVLSVRYEPDEVHDHYPVKATIRMIHSPLSGGFEVSYTTDGLMTRHEEDSWDLIAEVEVNLRELWINLYTKPGNPQPIISEGYPTEFQARMAAKCTENTLLGTVMVWNSQEGICNGNH